jgi:hypothetical protein
VSVELAALHHHQKPGGYMMDSEASELVAAPPVRRLLEPVPQGELLAEAKEVSSHG